MTLSELNYSDCMNTAADNMGAFYRKCLRGKVFDLALEVGCSGGGVLRQMPAKLKCGVDLDIDNLKLVRSKGDYSVVGSAEEELPFKDNCFDLIIATDLFEHLVRPDISIIQMKRVLKTEGFLLTHVPNEFRWQNLIKLLTNESFISKYWFPGSCEYNYPHVRFFSKNGFRRFLEKQGFVIMEDWTTLRAGILGRLTKHQLFLPGPTYLCQVK